MIATGGLGRIIEKETELIDVYESYAEPFTECVLFFEKNRNAK